MHKRHGVVVLLVTLMAASSAFAKAPPAPAWCKVDGQIEQGSIDTVKNSDEGPRAIVAIAYMMCHPEYTQDDDVAPLAAAYKKWSARLELTDAEWGEMAQLATNGGNLEIRALDEKAKWSGLSPIDQYAYMMYRLVQTPGLGGEADYFYVADAFGSRLSEVGRLAFIDQCLHHGSGQVAMAMCQPDIDAFDMHKIVAELRADKTHSPAVRAAIRLVADRDRDLLKQRAVEVKALFAKDDAFKKMFAIAAQAHKDWDAHAKDLADYIAIQDQMDDAMISNSRKASAGCHETTFKALQAAISKLPAKSFSVKRIPDHETDFGDDVINRVVEIVLADPAASLAASAYTQCEMLDPSPKGGDNLAKTFSTTMSQWGGYRGPRSATYSQIILANLQFDDRDVKLDWPRLERIWFKQSNAHGGGNNGTVESVKTKADVSTVTFGAHPVKEVVDTGCSRSNHVVGIRGDGSIEYEYNCTGHKTITYDGRPEPIPVRSHFVAGLKPGNGVLINTDIVWMAWPKLDASVPSYVLGQAVK